MKKLSLILVMVIFTLVSFRCQEEPAPTEEDIIDNVTGKWTATMDDGSGVTQSFEVGIIKISSTEFKIANFINNGDTATANLSHYNVTVPMQTLGDVEVEGTGVVSDDLQRIDWTVYLDGEEATMTFVPGGITK